MQLSRPVQVVSILSVLLSCTVAGAGTETLSFAVKGSLDARGVNNGVFVAGPGNTLVGRSGSRFPKRAYFVFDLASIGAEVVSARLETDSPFGSYLSPDDSETLMLFDYTSDIAILQNQNSINVAAYEDLGDGLAYGSQLVSEADERAVVSFDFNASGVADINRAAGSLFAFGLTMATIDRPVPSRVHEVFYAFSGNDDGARLVVELIPEPSTIAISLISIVGVLLRRQRLVVG